MDCFVLCCRYKIQMVLLPTINWFQKSPFSWDIKKSWVVIMTSRLFFMRSVPCRRWYCYSHLARSYRSFSRQALPDIQKFFRKSHSSSSEFISTMNLSSPMDRTRQHSSSRTTSEIYARTAMGLQIDRNMIKLQGGTLTLNHANNIIVVTVPLD